MAAENDHGLKEPMTPTENQGDDAKEAVGSPPSTSLGSWDVAAFTAAEKKTWPSVALFAVSPLQNAGRNTGENAVDEVALEECLRTWKRKQLQKLKLAGKTRIAQILSRSA